MSNIQSVPAIPIRDDPLQNAQWKNWFLQLTRNVNGTWGVANGGTGINIYVIGDLIYASATQILSRLADVATKQVLVSGGVGVAPAWSASPTLSGNLSVEGNTTLGDASADTLTINAGTWTYGSNWTATRAVGAAPAGATFFQQLNTTFSGDAGGTTDGRSLLVANTISGSNSAIRARAMQFACTILATAGTVTNADGISGALNLNNAASVTNAAAVAGQITITSTGNVSTGFVFSAQAPSLTSTGAFTTLAGFRAANLGHATLVTNALGFDAANMTVSGTLTASFRSAQNTGTGAWGFLHTGTANNAFNGDVRIGSSIAPTVALDVTGTALISGQVRVSSTTGISAAGTVQGNATALTTVCNGITTAAAGSGVRLRAGSTGEWQTVYNGGANAVNVYPPSGANINQLAANVPHILATNTACQFSFFSSTLIIGILSN